MQQRWTDRADDDTDPIERLMAFSSTFLRRHIGWLVKVFPPLFGFAIFVLYFYRNGFYPSFDLFQFSSLLIAAACIGFCVVLLLVTMMFIPGAGIFHLFMTNKPIREKLRDLRPAEEARKNRWVLLLVSLAYFLPYLLYGAMLLAVAYFRLMDFLLAVFVLPVPIALLFGIALQQTFELKAHAVLKYVLAAYAPLLCIGCLITYTVAQTGPVLAAISSVWLSWGLQILIPPLIAFLACICSMAHFAGWNPALHFSTFFAVIIGGYSGILTTLPETTVKKLGLGNYEATSIVLAPEYCEGGAQARLALGEGCALDDVHVVWSLGENITLRLGEKRLGQIPAHFVRAVIRKED